MLAYELPQKAFIEFKPYEVDRASGDCRGQTFSILLNYLGYEIDPIDIFSLGNGLDFKISEAMFRGLNLVGIQGRDFEAETNCCNLLNIPCEKKYSKWKIDNEEAKAPFDIEILSKVAKGEPALINCDIYYMDYITDITRRHNRYHMVIMIGYDLEKETVTVFDILTNKNHEIPMIKLREAMFKKSISSLEDGLWYDIKKCSNVQITKDKYLESIKIQGENALSKDGSIENLEKFIGFVERIENRAKEGSANHEKYLVALLQANCLLIRRQDELNGTFYRSIYEEFLKRNSKDSPDIMKAAKLMKKSGALWRKLAFKVRYVRGSSIKQCDLFISFLKEIYKIEKEMNLYLKEYVKKKESV
ncbi:MAG: BtrH N-terminal domain-containing protein [Clostridium sp.]|nr:BtrH N-terminal domain-containing protein [Clostridium sp.]